MSSDRVAMNEKIAFEKWEDYAKPIDRGRHVHFGDSYIMAPEFVMMSPHFNDGVPQTTADMFSGEVADAMARYAPDGDMLTAEWRMCRKHRFADPEPWDRMIGLIGLDPKGLTGQECTVNFLREGGVDRTNSDE